MAMDSGYDKSYPDEELTARNLVGENMAKTLGLRQREDGALELEAKSGYLGGDRRVSERRDLTSFGLKNWSSSAKKFLERRSKDRRAVPTVANLPTYAGRSRRVEERREIRPADRRLNGERRAETEGGEYDGPIRRYSQRRTTPQRRHGQRRDTCGPMGDSNQAAWIPDRRTRVDGLPAGVLEDRRNYKPSKLETALVEALMPCAGERGSGESAVECLRRIINERDQLIRTLGFCQGFLEAQGEALQLKK